MEKNIVLNRRATHDYEILHKWEAGIQLKGSEVKSVKQGKVSIKDSFARMEDGELYLYHLTISPYQPASPFSPPPERKRKLLLRKEELKRIAGKLSAGGLVIIPLRIYIKGGWVKVEIALARPLRKYEKKERIKKRELEREISRTLKHSI